MAKLTSSQGQIFSPQNILLDFQHGAGYFCWPFFVICFQKYCFCRFIFCYWVMAQIIHAQKSTVDFCLRFTLDPQNHKIKNRTEIPDRQISQNLG